MAFAVGMQQSDSCCAWIAYLLATTSTHCGAHKVLFNASFQLTKLNKSRVPTRIIRLHFNHCHLEYFTELDAVLLTGIKFNPQNRPFYTPSRIDGPKRGRIQRRLDKLCFRPKPCAPNQSNADAVLSDLLENGLEKFIVSTNDSIERKPQACASFQTLPVSCGCYCVCVVKPLF